MPDNFERNLYKEKEKKFIQRKGIIEEGP